MSSTNDTSSPSPRLVRPVDIPIYGYPQEKSSQVGTASEPGYLQSAIQQARLALREVTGPLGEFREKANHIYETGVAHSREGYNQLLDEENGAARLGAVGLGTLLGYTIGSLRGRILKKIFYSTLGFAGSAALAFPKESSEVLEEAKEEGLKLYAIGVNFVNGVEPEAKKEDIKDLLSESDIKDLKNLTPDFGQSNPADKDLYSTRG